MTTTNSPKIQTTAPFPITTSLNRIFAANPCRRGKLRALGLTVKGEPDDEPIFFSEIVRAAGLQDALWCCRAEPQHFRLWRLYAVWCARSVQHLTRDQRSIDILDVAERHAHGLATDEELAAAYAVAWAARPFLEGAWTAYAAAKAAACAAARAAAYAAALAAAEAAALAAGDARNAQRAAFLQLVSTGTLPDHPPLIQ